MMLASVAKSAFQLTWGENESMTELQGPKPYLSLPSEQGVQLDWGSMPTNCCEVQKTSRSEKCHFGLIRSCVLPTLRKLELFVMEAPQIK